MKPWVRLSWTGRSVACNGLFCFCIWLYRLNCCPINCMRFRQVIFVPSVFSCGRVYPGRQSILVLLLQIICSCNYYAIFSSWLLPINAQVFPAGGLWSHVPRRWRRRQLSEMNGRRHDKPPSLSWERCVLSRLFLLTTVKTLLHLRALNVIRESTS